MVGRHRRAASAAADRKRYQQPPSFAVFLSENRWINQQLWGRTLRCRETGGRRIRALAKHLKGTLYEFREGVDLDILVIENALTISMNIPLGNAIAQFLLETQMPAIAHHHDFRWESQRFQLPQAGGHRGLFGVRPRHRVGAGCPGWLGGPCLGWRTSRWIPSS